MKLIRAHSTTGEITTRVVVKSYDDALCSIDLSMSVSFSLFFYSFSPSKSGLKVGGMVIDAVGQVSAWSQLLTAIRPSNDEQGWYKYDACVNSKSEKLGHPSANIKGLA